MNRAWVILMAVMIVPDLSATPDSLFQKAIGQYQEGEYEVSLQVFSEIIDQGHESPDLYYNMGNAAFRSNNIGQAILYYEKALKMEPSHEDAAHNLEFVARYRVDTFEEVPELFIRTWWGMLVKALSERAWSLITLFCFLIILAGVLFYLFSNKLAIKKVGFISAIVSVFLFILTLSSALTRHRSMVQPQSGIVLSPSVVVRSSPSESGTELFILHEGTKIRVNEEVSGWHNIKVIDGREGWILSRDFESI
jgi:hypothetical protein